MITVSVLMPVYNHEKFLNEAIIGVISQKSSFNIELIISNDCSNDNSNEIIKSLIDNSSSKVKIRYYNHSVNKGMVKNVIWLYNKAKGKYVAFCEGDDYWIDNYKLQKQIDFMEKNKNHVLCFHPIKILLKNGKIVEDFVTTLPKTYCNRIDLIKNGNYIHTVSVLFKKIDIDFPSVVYNSPELDFIFFILITKHGKIGYIDENMAIYRYNVGTLNSVKKNKLKNKILLNSILLKIVETPQESDYYIQKLEKLIDKNLINLDFNILTSNIKNLPLRIFRKIFHILTSKQNIS